MEHKMEHKVVIDGIEYVPKEEKSSTQGLTDRELINRSMFDLDKYPKEKRGIEDLDAFPI
jgi:hypothetical protein